MSFFFKNADDGNGTIFSEKILLLLLIFFLKIIFFLKRVVGP